MNTNTHIVIARYHEDISWTSNLKYKCTIYNKGLENLNVPYIKIPNIGRESGTYLQFIVDNYYNLPDHLILLQGNPTEYCKNLFERIENFDSNTITYLTDSMIPNDLRLVPQSHTDCVNILVKELHLYEYLENYKTPQYNYAWGAQFIVPKKYIVTKPFEFWNKLYKLHETEPVTPWALERMFPFIFNLTM